MAPRCVLTVLLVAALFCSVAPASARAFPAPAKDQDPHGEAVLTFPFENTGHDPSIDWLSEGLAELTNERIQNDGPRPLSRQDRLEALEHMGLPAGASLSVATMYKVAELADADDVIFGSYASDGKSLTITARVLSVSPPSMSPPFRESGAIGDLMTLESRLAWRILCALEPGPPGSATCGTAANESDFRAKLLPLLPSAFELYIRGLIGPDEEQRLHDLHEAARLDPEWDAPVLALGEDYFDRQDCASALVWLSRVPPARPGGIQAGFSAGVCHLLLKDPPRAEAAFRGLLDPPTGVHIASGPLPEVRNDLGVALAREGKPADAIAELNRATRLDPEEPDYWFNLGVIHLQQQQPAAAVAPLETVLRLQPTDSQASRLLALALQQSGQSAQPAPPNPPPDAAPAPPAAPDNGDLSDLPGLLRVRTHLDPGSLRPAPSSETAAASSAAGASATLSVGDHAQILRDLARGRQLLRQGSLDDAQRAFVEALQLAPLDPDAHIGLGEVYRRQGRPDDAIREYRAALANRDDAPTRVALARLLVEDNRPLEARAELQQALKLQPGDVAAQRLLDQLEENSGDRQ